MKVETVIGAVEIVEKPSRTYLGIRFETPFPGLFAQVTRELKTLRKWVKEKQLLEEGPYFVRYYHCDMKSLMDVEVGFVTATAQSDEAGIKPGTLPQGRYASLIYRGNGLRGNQALMKWARDTGATFDSQYPDLAESYTCRYEAYLTDYRVESRKLLWDVELSIKLAAG